MNWMDPAPNHPEVPPSWTPPAPLGSPAAVSLASGTRWLYALGNLGVSLPYQAVGAVLLFFYTDVRHLPPLWASAVMAVYALYNAFNNPLAGYASDRTRTRWGRRIPYILFGMGPYALFFALLFLVPYDGRDRPAALLAWFAGSLFLFESAATLVQMSYHALLPEMFREYRDRTAVAVRMNLFMIVALVLGAALPIPLARALGWGGMGALLAAVTLASLVFSLQGMREHARTLQDREVPFREALRATLLNRSFLTIVAAQTMRHFTTSIAATGHAFFTKYSLGIDPAYSSLVLAALFLSAAGALYPWRRLLADRFDPRRNLMIAYTLMAVSTLLLFLARSLVAVVLTALFMGIALAGLLLMEDVVLSDVIDEDRLRTGQRREGMFFGMNSLIVTLAYALSSGLFGWIAQAYGYDPLLADQPASAALGFRIYMSLPPAVGSLLALAALWGYPLHGKRLAQVKDTLRQVDAG